MLLVLAAIPGAQWWRGLVDLFNGSAVQKFEAIAATVLALLLSVGTIFTARKTNTETSKSRGDDIFERASAGAIRNRACFMNDAKTELSELFKYMREVEPKIKTRLTIVAFVDDLDRCIGGDKIKKMLEAVQLLLSIDAAPVITFLAIDPRIIVSSIEESFTKVMRDTHVTGWECDAAQNCVLLQYRPSLP